MELSWTLSGEGTTELFIHQVCVLSHPRRPAACLCLLPVKWAPNGIVHYTGTLQSKGFST